MNALTDTGAWLSWPRPGASRRPSAVPSPGCSGDACPSALLPAGGCLLAFEAGGLWNQGPPREPGPGPSRLSALPPVPPTWSPQHGQAKASRTANLTFPSACLQLEKVLCPFTRCGVRLHTDAPGLPLCAHVYSLFFLFVVAVAIPRSLQHLSRL